MLEQVNQRVGNDVVQLDKAAAVKPEQCFAVWAVAAPLIVPISTWEAPSPNFF